MTTHTATCICGSDREDGFMICCDECDTWMHGPCVSVTKSFATGIDLYFCPRCRPSQSPSTTGSSRPSTPTTIDRTPLKRAPGRPRRFQDMEPEVQSKRTRERLRTTQDDGRHTPTTATTAAKTTSTHEDPPKRGRGRPRKIKVMDGTTTSSQSSRSPSPSLSWLLSPYSSSSSPSSSLSGSIHMQKSRLTEMSEEILLQILAFVQCHKSISRVGATCRRLWRISHDPYLWKHVTLNHDIPLRRHWEQRVKPLLLSNNIQELTLLGEIPPPVHIYALSLDNFSSLQALRLEDIQTYSVYVLVRSLPWLRVFEARKIKGLSSSESSWDWRPFQHLTQLEELLLWRNEEEMSSAKTFSFSSSPALPHGADEIYPFELIQAATDALGSGPGSIAAFMGMTNESFDLFVSDVEEHGFQDEEDDEEEEESDDGSSGSGAPMTNMVEQTDSDPSGGSSQNYLVGSTVTNTNTSIIATQDREVFLPRLRKLALINIGSPTTHRGTDAVIRKLVSRVHSFIYGNSFNILFPVLRTNYSQLRHLCLLEPSGPAWKNGTWQNHVAVFAGMVRLETLTLVNPNMSRKFMLPILNALLGLERLRLVHVVALEQDMENVDVIFRHVVMSRWHNNGNRRLKISLKDDRRDVWNRRSLRRSLLHKVRADVEMMLVDDGISSSDSGSSSSSRDGKKKDKGFSSMEAEEIWLNEEWCDWACEQVKAAGHIVVGWPNASEAKDRSNDGSSSSSSSSGDRSNALSVEIEMVSSWQGYDSDLSKVCLEAWRAR